MRAQQENFAVVDQRAARLALLENMPRQPRLAHAFHVQQDPTTHSWGKHPAHLRAQQEHIAVVVHQAA
jgi:hypothetical protein